MKSHLHRTSFPPISKTPKPQNPKTPFLKKDIKQKKLTLISNHNYK